MKISILLPSFLSEDDLPMSINALSIVLEEEMLSVLILIQDSGSFRTLYARCRTALPVNCLFSTARNTVSPAVGITDPLS
jgi:hypothetical protein